MCVHVNVHTNMHTIYTHSCIYIYIYIYVHKLFSQEINHTTYIYIYTYIHVHTLFSQEIKHTTLMRSKLSPCRRHRRVIYTCMHTCLPMCVCVKGNVYTACIEMLSVCIYMWIHACVCMYVQWPLCGSLGKVTCVCACTHTQTHVYVFLCVFI